MYKKLIYGIVFLFLIVNMQTVFAQTDYDIINLEADVYNYKPSPVNSGDEFELWIQLTNNSNTTAKNIEYVLETDYPFKILDYNKNGLLKINELSPYQSKVIKYNLSVDNLANTKTYNLDFKYKREGIETYSIKTYEIDVDGKKPLIEPINIDVEDISIGKNSEISIDFKNIGKKDAKDIFISLNDSVDESVKVNNLKTRYIESLEINDSEKISYEISVLRDFGKKNFSLPLTIKYSDSDKNYEINREIGLSITDNPIINLNVISLGKNNSLISNTTNNIELEIYNTGNIDAESVYVELISDSIVSSKKSFIGTIEKDDYDTIDIDFKTKNLTGTKTLEINTYYKNKDLELVKHSKEIEVDFLANNKENTPSILNIILYVLGLIVGLSIFVLIFKWLLKILIKPAYKTLISIFKRK